MEMLISFSSRTWHLPTLPKVPKAGTMTMVLLCLIGQQTPNLNPIEYILCTVCPSNCCIHGSLNVVPQSAALMQPQTMTLPPACLTVGKTHLSFYSSSGCRPTRLTPSEPNKFILVSSTTGHGSSNPCP